MNELIKVTEKDGKSVVSAREMYLGLGLDKSQWSRWRKKNIVENDFFKENVDYAEVRLVVEGNETVDYAITLDFAKHLSMMARTENSHQFRQYFIECEKQLRSISLPSYMLEDPIERAKKWIVEQEEKKALELENAQQKQVLLEYEPKVTYYDEILATQDTITITQIAKDYGLSANALNKKLHTLGVQFKQSDTWLLYHDYADKGYTKSQTTTYKDGKGDTHSKLHTRWTQKGRLFLYDLLKNNDIVPTIEKEYDK